MRFQPPGFTSNIAAQYQCRDCCPTGLIITLAPSDLAKSGAAIEPSRGLIILVDFQKYRAASGTGQPAQVQVKQTSRQPAAPIARSNGDGENFGFAGSEPRQHKPREFAVIQRALRDDISFAKQLCE